MPSRQAATRPILGNIGLLTGSHALGLIVPLVTVPFLARVLRPEGWAPVLVAQALAAWVAMLLEYGFDLSGTRAVAQARTSSSELADVVWAVQGAKVLLLPLAVILMAAGIVFIPVLREDWPLALCAVLFAAARGFSPFWYFQGQERFKRAVAVDTTAKVLAAIGVFVVVSAPQHAWRVLALQAVFTTISCSVLTQRLWHEVPPPPRRRGRAAAMLRASWPLFAFRASSTLYVHANTVLLGVLATAPVVAAFGGAERIVRAAVNLLEPVTRVFLPRISFLSTSDPARASRLIVRCLIGIGLAGLFVGVAMAVTAPILVRLLLGRGYEAAVPVLRILSLLPPIVAVGTVLGAYWALPFKRERTLLLAAVLGGIVNIALALYLIPVAGAAGMAVAVVIAEFIVAAGLTITYTRWRAGQPQRQVATA